MNETCSNMREEIAGYLLDALDEKGRQAVEEHLKGCPDCRAYMQMLQKQEQALMMLGEQIGAGMTEREERVIAAVGRVSPRVLRFGFAKWAVAAMLILSVGVLIGRLTSPGSIDADRLKAEVRRAILTDVDRRLNLVVADTADQMQVMAAQLASGSKAMMDARLTELVQMIETARRTDRQRIADALVQMELSRLDDRNQIAASLRSLVTPAAELSAPTQKAPTTTNN
jgi:hypothetical protein